MECDFKIIIMSCFAASNTPVPYNGEIRLVPDPTTPVPEVTTSSGQVELFSNGQWKGACLDGASTQTLNRLCRQLGYTEMDMIRCVCNSSTTKDAMKNATDNKQCN